MRSNILAVFKRLWLYKEKQFLFTNLCIKGIFIDVASLVLNFKRSLIFLISLITLLCRCSDWDTDCTTEECCFDFLQGKRFFLVSKTSRPAMRPIRTPSQWVLRSHFPEINRPEHEAANLQYSAGFSTKEEYL